DTDRVAALIRIGMSTVNREASGTDDDGAARYAAVAPDDGGREVAGRGIGVGVREGRDRCADRRAFRAGEAHARGGERRVADARRAVGAGGAAALVGDRDADRVAALVHVGGTAID